MSYYMTSENSVLNINNAHLKVSGNIQTDVMKLGAIEFAPPASDVPGTVNFTNVTTGVTTSSNLNVGGTLMLGTVEVVGTPANTANLHDVVNLGNVTSNTVQFTNATTGIVATGNVEASKFIGDGSLLTGITTIESNVDLIRNTNNTAFINLNSNVVAEFPRSKKLIKYPRVAMTANDNSGTSGYVADQTNTASHGNADAYAYRLFDNTSGGYQSGTAYSSGNPTVSAPTTTASDGSTHQGVAITLDLVTKIRLDHVVITSHSNYGRTPVDGTFLGSDNSSVWDVIQTFSGLSTSADNQKHTITITNSSQKLAYRYIRFVVTKTHTSPVFNAGSLLEFRELQYFGVPEYDPDAHGTDVTVKSYPNVPNTDWLEVYYDGRETSSYSGSGTTVNDLSGNGVTGTLTAQGGFENVDNIKAFTSSGSTTHALTATTSLSGSPVMTISAWVKFDSFAQTSIIYLLGNLGVNNEMVWLGAQSNGSIWTLANGGAGAYNQYSNDTLVLNSWIHVAAIYSGGTYPEGLSLYINGILLTPTVRNGSGVSLTLPSNSPLYLGFYNSGTEFFDGSIANFRLFNRALTSDEIYQLYAYQKEDFGHGDLSMTLKAGRLGIGTSEPRAALDVRGDIAGRFTRFLTYDHVVHSSTTFNSSPSWPIGQSLSLVSHTWDIPTEYATLGRGTLNGYAYVSWSGSCPNPWQAVFWIDIYYNGVYMGRGSTNSDVGNTSANHGNTTVAVTSHDEDNNASLDSANVTTGFRLPNCNLSRGSTIKIDLICQRGDYQSGENVVWTNRNHTAPSSNARDYEQGTTNFFVLLNVE